MESLYLRVIGMRGGESYLKVIVICCLFYLLEVKLLESYWNESLRELF